MRAVIVVAQAAKTARVEWEGTGSRIFEIHGLQSALTASVCCIQCHSGGMLIHAHTV